MPGAAFPIPLTATEAVCALGADLPACVEAWRAGQSGLKVAEDGRLYGRIPDRSLLKGRRYAAASNLAVQAARGAVAKAGWSAQQLRETWLFAASSRGNAAVLLDEECWRRPVRRFSASNSLHSEIAAAVSIELGIRGPWQMLSSGCAAGLDALGMAWAALRAGCAQRALVVAVDLPLLPELVRDFTDTHLLAPPGTRYDPLSPTTDGLCLGEAAAAVTLELGQPAPLYLTHYAANSDAYDSLMIPPDGAPLAELLQTFPTPRVICPHATGTRNHAQAELAALKATYGAERPALCLLKPLTGHTLGASGLLDVALLHGALPTLPVGLPDLAQGFKTEQRLRPGDLLLKLASGMGGHNAAVQLQVGQT
jgi:3-oxoacyl-[acyl-carrier-protein] synthase II